MDPAAVVKDLESWRRDYEAGRVRRGLGGPRVEPGERLAVDLGRVVVDDEARQALDDDLVIALRPDGLGGPLDGTAFATSRRLVVVGRRDRRREWQYEDTYSMRVLPRGQAVVVQPYEEDDIQLRVTLVGPQSLGRIVHGRSVIPATDPTERLKVWLRVEAAFVAASGTKALDDWFQQIPARLTIP